MKLKKLAIIGAMGLIVGGTSLSASAASEFKTPADAVAAILGRTVESVINERIETGKTYGTIASEAGKLDEFKTENLEVKKDNLAGQVEAETITQEKADEITQLIEENQEDCDGTGTAQIGRNTGAKFGSNGTGQGNGSASRGTGVGRGLGRR